MKQSGFLLLSGMAAAFLFCACTASSDSLATKMEQEVSSFPMQQIEQTTAVQTTVVTTTTERTPQLLETIPERAVLEVDPIFQNPELPTGCEITSLTALLQYLGFDVEKETMANEYLFCTYDTAKYTLEDAYIGTPDAEDGFGCYAPVLVDAADRYLQTQNGEQKAIDLTGSNEETICRYVASGYPVVMWITIGLYDVYEELGWTTEDGEEVMWCELEHCVLLHGYDKEEGTVYVCDPLNGDVTYDMERYFQIYEEMHSRAMTIY